MLYVKIEKRDQIKFVPNDVYITLDAFWNTDKDIARLIHAKNSGAKVLILIHDILPMSHPQWFEKSNIRNFKKFLSEAVNNSDVLLFSSDAVINEFRKRFKLSNQAIHKICLGSNSIRSNLKRRIWNREGCIVMVGTIEPRKNYLEVLKWFRKSQIPNPLIIVGRPGWKSAKVKFIIRIMKMQGKNIKWIKNANDHELSQILERASIGICASKDEGFGLPLREFLEIGLPVVASDIPVFREIESQNIKYFNLGNLHELEAAVESTMNQGFIRESVKFTQWDDAYNALMLHV